MHFLQKSQGRRSNIRVSRSATSHFEEMPPLTRVHRYHDLSFGALWQDRTSLLGLSAKFKQLHIVLVGVLHGFQPDFQLDPFIIASLAVPEGWSTDSNAAAKLVITVVTIPGGFLAEGGDTVPNKLMGYAAINNETRRDSAMLENALVAALDDAGDKLLGGAIANLTL